MGWGAGLPGHGTPQTCDKNHFFCHVFFLFMAMSKTLFCTPMYNLFPLQNCNAACIQQFSLNMLNFILVWMLKAPKYAPSTLPGLSRTIKIMFNSGAGYYLFMFNKHTPWYAPTPAAQLYPFPRKQDLRYQLPWIWHSWWLKVKPNCVAGLTPPPSNYDWLWLNNSSVSVYALNPITSNFQDTYFFLLI